MVLCIAAAPVVFGQGPGKKTLTRPPLDDTKIINSATSFPTATVPQLYGMNRTGAQRFLESLHFRAIFSGVENGVVVAQKPPAGTTVRAGSEVAVILGVLPQVVLTGPAAPAYAGNDLTVTATLVPPIPSEVQVTYYFQWNDGTPSVPTKSAVATHRFTEAAKHLVTVTVVINDRVKVNGRIPIDVVAVPLATVPPLVGLNRSEVEGLLEKLHLRPKFSGSENGIAMAQDPAAGTTVKYGTVIAVTLGVLPRLVLAGPAAPAYAGSDLTFTAELVPPLPAGFQATYSFAWDDGTAAVSTKNAVVTHRFAEAGKHLVSVTAVINDRFKIRGGAAVDVVPVPPSSDTTPSTTAPPETTTTIPTETQPTTTTQPTDTTPTTTTAPTTTVFIPEKPVNPNQNALLLIGVIAIILLLTVVGLLVRVLRKMSRAPSAPAASPLVIKGGPGSVEVEIEHSEQIRKGPSVLVRGGIRPEGDDDA